MTEWGMVWALFIVTLAYSSLLAISELPDVRRPLDTCAKHPGSQFCACRKNLPRGKK